MYRFREPDCLAVEHLESGGGGGASRLGWRSRQMMEKKGVIIHEHSWRASKLGECREEIKDS